MFIFASVYFYSSPRFIDCCAATGVRYGTNYSVGHKNTCQSVFYWSTGQPLPI